MHQPRRAKKADNVGSASRRIWAALDEFRIEVPSWGFANTGTRFGKFIQAAAATTIEEKFSDAAQVNALTEPPPPSPSTLLGPPQRPRRHPHHPIARAEIQNQSRLHQSQSLPGPAIQVLLHRQPQGRNSPPRRRSPSQLRSHRPSPELPRHLPLGIRRLQLPRTQSIRKRITWLQEAFASTHAALGDDQRLLVEYKPFEPFFYHTDIADWGMALELARSAGPKAKVLVDTGHHYQGTNIEQIVAWLVHLNALGGFHFNDRKYADDDLTLGSVDPYQVFRIFHEILTTTPEQRSTVAFMIDQSHNLKGKLEAMVQTVVSVQELYAKASLIDLDRLAAAVLTKLSTLTHPSAPAKLPPCATPEK